jgi:hypothetical protein
MARAAQAHRLSMTMVAVKPRLLATVATISWTSSDIDYISSLDWPGCPTSDCNNHDGSRRKLLLPTCVNHGPVFIPLPLLVSSFSLFSAGAVVPSWRSCLVQGIIHCGTSVPPSHLCQAFPSDPALWSSDPLRTDATAYIHLVLLRGTHSISPLHQVCRTLFSAYRYRPR